MVSIYYNNRENTEIKVMLQNQLVPRIVDEIEFYISDDGKHLGMSISGLAKLCGIGRKSLSDILAKLSESEPTESGVWSRKISC